MNDWVWIIGLVLFGSTLALAGYLLEADATYISVPPSGAVTPSQLNIALGLVDGYRMVDKFGKNPDVDTSFEDVWNSGGTITLLTSASTIRITSSGVDTSGGVGARTVTIQGLNGTWNEVEETVTLNSTTPPVTSESFIRVNRAFVVESGTSLTNVNDITFTAVTGGSTQATIFGGEGQTQKTQYTVPAGYTGFLTSGHFSTDSGSHVEAQIMTKNFGESWRVKHDITLTTGFAQFNLAGSTQIPEKSDIKWRAFGTNPNNEVQGGYTLVLRNDS